MSEKKSSKISKSTLGKGSAWILAVISMAALGMDYEIAAEVDGGGIIFEILSSLHGWGIGQLIFTICLACIYMYVIREFILQWDIIIFSVLLSLLIVIGLCYQNATGIVLTVFNVAQIVKTCIILIGYSSMFYCAILFLQNFLFKIAAEKMENRVTVVKFYRIKVGVFLFLCWLPYLVAFYPGTTLYDAGTMLEQFYGYLELTNHHPYFQILMLGLFVKAGAFLGSGAAGMFVYVFIQVCAFIAVLSYMMGILRDMKLSRKVRKVLIYIYAFLPVFPLYAISVGKNINFAIVVLLLTVFMFEICINADSFVRNRKKMILLPVMLMLSILFRNEGLAIAIGCCLCYIFLAKQYRKIFVGIFGGVLILAGVWFKCVLPFAGVAEGSIAEGLSIPFMQTARSVCYYSDEMTEEDKRVIDNILKFDTLAERYNPEISDYVKRDYNENVSNEDIQAYTKVYWKQFFEHPITYIDAFLNKCYGYFYPDDKGRIKAWFVVGADVPTLNADGYDLKSKFPRLVKGMDNLMNTFREIPLLGYLTSIGFYTWCTFLSIFFIVKGKKRRLLYIFVPAVLVLLVCVASPVNAYFRYGLPVVFSVPFFAAVTLWSMMPRESQGDSKIVNC